MFVVDIPGQLQTIAGMYGVDIAQGYFKTRHVPRLLGLCFVSTAISVLNIATSRVNWNLQYLIGDSVSTGKPI